MSSYLLIFTGTFHAKNVAKKCYDRRFRASKVAKFSTLPTMMKEVIRKFGNFIYSALFSSLSPSLLKAGLAALY